MLEHCSWVVTAHPALDTREGDFALTVGCEPPLSGSRQCSAFAQQHREQEGRKAQSEKC